MFMNSFHILFKCHFCVGICAGASLEFEKGCSTDFKVARNSFHFAKRVLHSLLNTVWFIVPV